MEENIYRKARKNAARKKPLLNNCESAQDLVYIERTKLLAIESGDKIPSPDDVLSMSKVYDAPELCNYYCTNQCPIGKDKPTLIYSDLNDAWAVRKPGRIGSADRGAARRRNRFPKAKTQKPTKKKKKKKKTSVRPISLPLLPRRILLRRRTANCSSGRF